VSASRKAQQTLALLPSPGFVALRCRVKSKVEVLDANYRLSKSGVTLLGKMKEEAPRLVDL